MGKKILELDQVTDDQLNAALLTQSWVGVDMNNNTSWRIKLLDLVNFILSVSGSSVVDTGDGGSGGGGGGTPATPAYDPAQTYLLESGEPLQTEDGQYLLIE